MKKNIVFGVSVANVFAFLLWMGCGRPDPPEETHPGEVHYWDLPTGSHLAYGHIPARDSSNRTPVVFVHGGPGAYQVSDNLSERPRKWFRHLARHGFDVYYYDQIGSGLSARLSNPSEYTVARHVADLEAIRATIGDAQLILVGGSFGASLVAHYMAAYPHNVLKAVFMCPGYMDASEWTGDRPAVPQMTPEFRQWINRTAKAGAVRRYAELDALMRTDLQAAYAMAPDSEMDPLCDEFVDSILPATVYHKNLMAGKHSRGMGWWSYTMTGRDAISGQFHPRAVLAGNRTPVLIIRGDADYVPEAAARQYETTFPNAVYVPVERAGHYVWLDQPDAFRAAIESFLGITPGDQSIHD